MPIKTSRRARLWAGYRNATLGLFAAGCLASASGAESATTNPPTNRPIPVHILAGYGTNMTVRGTNWLAGDKFFPDGETIERPDIAIATGTNTEIGRAHV